MRYLVNGEGLVLGRLSSSVAKLLLQGNEVVVVNAEKIMITGHAPDIIAKFKRLIELKDKANPEHSPYFSRRPDLMVKRVVRGMLPYKKPKGKTAYGRLRVYMGSGDTEGIKDTKAYDTRAKKASEAYENAITVKELSEKLGYGR